MKTSPSRRRILSTTIAALTGIALASTASATTYTWTSTTTGARDWTSTANWSGATQYVSGSGNELMFFADSTTNIAAITQTFTNVPATLAMNTLTLNGKGFSSGASSSTITVGNSSTWTIGDGTTSTVNLNANFGATAAAGFNTVVTAALTLNQATTLFTGNGTGGFTFSGNITDGVNDYGITKSGSSTLNLSGTNNTYSGTTTLSAGVLQGNMAASATPVSSFGTSALQLNGGTLNLRSNGAGSNGTITVGNNTTVGGNMTINVDRASANAGNTIALGTLSIGANTLTVTGANTYALSFGVTTLTGTAGFNVDTANLSITGAIGDGAGTFGFTKTGAGVLTLSGTNTYEGTTTVNAGTLSVSAAANLGDAAANLVINNGATLRITGTSVNDFADLGRTNPVVFASGQVVSLDIADAGNAFTVDQTLNQGTGGLTKLGVGTLVINTAQTYAGPTTVSAGTLRLDAGGVIATPILNNATFTGNSASALTQGTHFGMLGGTGTVIQAGAGAMTLNLANIHTGDTRINAGTLVMGHDLALQNSAFDTASINGGLVVTGYTTPILGGVTGSVNLSSTLITGYGSITNLTLNPQTGITKTYSGDIADGAAGMDLTKTGAGTQTLTGTNSYTGATNLNNGTLTLSGAAGSIASSTDLNFNGGNLTLTNTTGTEGTVNRVSDSASVTSNASGTLTYANSSVAAGVYLETIGSVALTSGQLNLVENTTMANGAQAQNNQTLALAGLTQSGSASVTFSAITTGLQTFGNRNMIRVNGITSDTATGTIIGPWATVGTTALLQTDYAVYDSDSTNGYVVGANITATGESAWTTAANSYTLANANGSATNGRLTATRNIDSLRNTTSAGGTISTAATDIVTMAGSTFSDGDVIVLGSTAVGLTAGVPYYVRDVSGTTFKLAATSGGTAIDITGNNTGTLNAGITLGANNLGTYGILNGVATPLVIGGSGGAVTLPTTTAGNLYVTAGAGNIWIDAPINNNTGALTLVKNGSNTLTLSSTASTYSGGTVINAGVLSTTADSNLGSGGGIIVNGTSQWTMGAASLVSYARSLTVNEGAVLTLSSGNAAKTVTGVLSGNGSIIGANSTGYIFTNTGNTFTGTVSNGYQMLFASIGDSSNPFNLVGSNSEFQWTGGAKDFALRPLTLNATGTGNFNNTGSGAVTFATDLAFSGAAGARTLSLGGTNAGANAFNGNIADGPGSVVSLTKAGAGTWTLSGANSYSGLTNVNGASGTLIMSGTNSSAGATTIQSGTLVFNNTSNGGIASGLLIISSGASVEAGIAGISLSNAVTLSTSSGGTTFKGTESIAFNGDVNFTGTSGKGINNTMTNGSTVTLNGDLILNNTVANIYGNNAPNSGSAQGTVIVNGVVRTGASATTAGSIVNGNNNGNGTLILTNNANSYAGSTTAANGILAGTAAHAFGDTTGIAITGSSAVLSLRGDASTSFTKLTGGALYNVTTGASGAAINVDQATIAGTSAKTMSIGTLTLNNAVTNNTNFTGANNTSLDIGAVTTSAAVSGTETLTNNISAGGSLTLASVSVLRTTTPTMAFAGTGNTTVAGAITQVATTALTKSGAGTLTLNGTNSYSGITTITAGVVEAAVLADGSSNSGIGASSNAAASLVFGASTSTLRYTGGSNVTIDRGFTTSSGAGGGATFESSGAGTLSFNNTVAIAYGTTNQTRTLTLGGTNTGANTFGKAIANNGTTTNAVSLVKSGAGTWVLDQNNGYTGTTAVNDGTLLVSGSISGSVATVTGSSSVLGGTGIVGAVTVNAGATLQGGDGVAASGALTSGGNVSLANGAMIKLTLGVSSTHSSLVRTGGTWAFDLDQAFVFNSGAAPGSYDNIISGLTGTEVGLASINTWTLNPEYAGSMFSYDGSGGVDLLVVPEPGAIFSLLGGLGMLVGLHRFRRRS